MRHRHLLLPHVLGAVCVLWRVALMPVEAQEPPDIPSVDVARGRLGPAAYPRMAMDPQGGTIQFDAPPERIVSRH